MLRLRLMLGLSLSLIVACNARDERPNRDRPPNAPTVPPIIAPTSAPATATLTRVPPSPTPIPPTATLPAPTATPFAIKPGTYELTVPFGGFTRMYVLVIPTTYDNIKPAPIVFFFHGNGQGARLMYEKRKDLLSIAERDGWIVVFPNGTPTAGSDPGFHWNALPGAPDPKAEIKNVDDVGFVRTLVGELMRGLKIDPKRIYSTGFSNGAMFSQLLGAELPETFAAITAVATTTGARAANDPTNTHYSLLTPKAPIPVMLTMGKRDNHVPPDGRPSDDGIIYDTASESIAFWAKANQCGGAPANEGLPNRAGIITRYNGCKADTVLVLLELMSHQWPDADTRDGFLASQAVMDFFKQHPKP